MSGAKCRALVPIIGVAFHVSRLEMRMSRNPFPSSSSVRGNRRSAPPSSLLCSAWFGWRKPERDVARLHRLLHHREQVLAQLRQINLIAKSGAKSSQRFGGIILAAVEAPVDDALDATAQGLEESGNDESRDHNGDRVILVEQPLKQRLQGNNEAKVQQGEQCSQAAIHQGAVDQQINVVESIAQNREPNRERD